jgi:hypothetical protein
MRLRMVNSFLCSAPTASAPAIAGEGDRPKGGGGGAGLNATSAIQENIGVYIDRLAAATTRRVQRPLHHAARGPPPPLSRGGWRELPRSRGACAPEFCQASHHFCLQKNKGRRSAGRRNCPVDPRHARRRCHPLALRARPRVQRDALASRRSTAALAEALTSRLNLGPRFLESPGANGRTLPGASAASSSRTGPSAGRAGPRGRPGADRILPPAGTALAPLSGVPS